MILLDSSNRPIYDIYDNDISYSFIANKYNRIQAQLSDHIKTEYPLMEEFLSAYYEFLDAQNQSTPALNIYSDIDTAVNSFKEYFYNELLLDIPKDVAVDRVLFAKHIKELYTNKGNENSLRLLFRILFNKEITYNLPSEEILKTSDGRWNQEFSILVKIPATTPFSTIELVVGKKILATISQIQVPIIVTRVIQKADIYSGYILCEFFIIKDFTDTLIVGNQIEFHTISNLNVISGGSGYKAGAELQFTSIDGSGATAIVDVVDGTITTATITNSGGGYLIPPAIEVKGTGSGAYITADVSGLFTGTLMNSISSPSIVQPTTKFNEGTVLAISPDNSYLPDANIVAELGELSTGGVLRIKKNDRGRITRNVAIIAFGNLYPDNFNYVFAETENLAQATAILLNGSVDSISVNWGGRGYSSVTPPTVYIQGDAQFTANVSAGGSVTSFTKISGGSDYTIAPAVYFSTNSLIVNFSSSVVRTYEGHYIDSRGMLSEDMYIYDGKYYQNYSYEIALDELFDSYKNVLKKIIHPAGFGVFGVYEQFASIYSPISVTKIQLDKSVSASDQLYFRENYNFAITKPVSDSVYTALVPETLKFNTTKPVSDSVYTALVPETLKFNTNKILAADTLNINAPNNEVISFSIQFTILDKVVVDFIGDSYLPVGYIFPDYYFKSDATFS